MLGNPLVGRFTRILFADGGKIFGRDVQIVGIRLNGAVLHLGRVQQIQKTLEVTFAS